MQPAGVLITNNGPHPADKWAELTVSQIVDVAGSEPGLKFRSKLAEILEGFHSKVASDEQNKLKKLGDDRLGQPLDVEGEQELDKMVDELAAVADGSEWAGHFASPDTRAYIRTLLKQHFRANMDVERSWHADRKPTARNKAWQRARLEVGARTAHKNAKLGKASAKKEASKNE